MNGNNTIIIIKCTDEHFNEILEIINDAAVAYKGHIPDDRWHEPYMSADYLKAEIHSGVEFWGYANEEGKLLGVMGIQDVKDVTLIRHAYVRTDKRNMGVGGILISHLKGMTDRPLLVGTWAAAVWAIRFYEKYGFNLVTEQEKEVLLRKYWNIPVRQVETSVVLIDNKSNGIKDTLTQI